MSLQTFDPKRDYRGIMPAISPGLFDERYIKWGTSGLKIIQYFENNRNNPEIMKHWIILKEFFDLLFQTIIQIGSDLLTQRGIFYDFIINLGITEKFFTNIVQIKFSDSPLNRSLLKRAVYSSLHNGLFPFTELELLIPKNPLDLINILIRQIEYNNPNITLIGDKKNFNRIISTLAIIYPTEITRYRQNTIIKMSKLSKIRTKFPNIITEQ